MSTSCNDRVHRQSIHVTIHLILRPIRPRLILLCDIGQHIAVKLGKDDVRYWKSRLKKRSYKSGGQTVEIEFPSGCDRITSFAWAKK